MTADRRQHVEDACAAIILDGLPVTFDEVAARTGLGRATLYRNPDLRAVVEEHRARGREALERLTLADIRTSFPQDQQSPSDVDHQGSTRGVRVERFVDDAPSVVDQDERQVVAVPDARGWKAVPSFAASPSIIPS